MNKILKSIFLIIISLGFLVGIANAQNYPPFYVKFTDADRNGKIEFYLKGRSIYNGPPLPPDSCIACHGGHPIYTGVATTDHNTISDPLLKIPLSYENPTASNSTFVSWEVDPGESLIYDIYLDIYSIESNIHGYRWTSGEYVATSSYNGGISISWIYVFYHGYVEETFEPTRGDNIQSIPVPIPSALWLLGSGAITLGLIHKKLLTR